MPHSLLQVKFSLVEEQIVTLSRYLAPENRVVRSLS